MPSRCMTVVHFILLAVLLGAGCGSPIVRSTTTSGSTTASTSDGAAAQSTPVATPTLAATASRPATSSTPSRPATSSTPPATSSAIHFSADGRHAFPVAGDLAAITWTPQHWDGSNAVDIEAARHLAADSPLFAAFTQRPVVAIVTGTIAIADNPAGGLALWLHGDDGFTYYYGHLSEQWVREGERVGVGSLLGHIGNSGRWTQYIEPHLHFAMGTEAADLRWAPDENAAEWFERWFGLQAEPLPAAVYAWDEAAGWPLPEPREIRRTFAERQAENPDLGSIDIGVMNSEDQLVAVNATLTGEVNVHRATALGLRVQITNRHSRTTVVYSFLQETTRTDGEVVQHGELIGYLAPESSLNYMLFLEDVQSDPAPTLGR